MCMCVRESLHDYAPIHLSIPMLTAAQVNMTLRDLIQLQAIALSDSTASQVSRITGVSTAPLQTLGPCRPAW
eukprot:m.116622 g.116622  ORF g.116622 m.116622 type:complete len:72 (-) comp14471_c0_seq3:433-648(-)